MLPPGTKDFGRSHMTPSDREYLTTITKQLEQPGARVFLVGPENGALTLDVASKAFSKASSRMNPELKAALLSQGAENGQASGHETHSFLKGATDFPLKADIFAQVMHERASEKINDDPDTGPSN